MKKVWIILLFLPLFSLAQEDAKVDLSNPNATIFTHLNFLQPSSYYPEKAAKTINGLSEKKAIEKAIKIKRVLDGKGLFVDFNQIPTNPNYNDSIGYSANYKFILFPTRMPQISVEKVGDKWFYSAETVRSIDAIYKDVYPWYVEKLQQIIPVFGHKKIIGIEIWQLIGLVVLLIVMLIGFYLIKKVAFFILQKIQYRITHSKNLVVNKVLKKLAHPISLLFAIGIIERIFPSLEFSLQTNKWVFLALDIAATVFWIYVFLKLVQVVMKIYAEFTEKTRFNCSLYFFK